MTQWAIMRSWCTPGSRWLQHQAVNVRLKCVSLKKKWNHVNHHVPNNYHFSLSDSVMKTECRWNKNVNFFLCCLSHINTWGRSKIISNCYTSDFSIAVLYKTQRHWLMYFSFFFMENNVMFLYGRATRKLKSSTQCITDHMDYMTVLFTSVLLSEFLPP